MKSNYDKNFKNKNIYVLIVIMLFLLSSCKSKEALIQDESTLELNEKTEE